MKYGREISILQQFTLIFFAYRNWPFGEKMSQDDFLP
jgi:hypothetical protein